MSVVSIRLNQKEEKILNTLSDHFNEDRSTLIKHSLQEMYEDTIDKKEIENFERDEKAGKTTFVSQKTLQNILKSRWKLLTTAGDPTVSHGRITTDIQIPTIKVK